MASIKVKFRPSTIIGHEGTIYYQIIHERKIRYISTGFRILTCEWDEKHSRIHKTVATGRRHYMAEIRRSIKKDFERIDKIIRTLESSGYEYCASDIVEEYNCYMKKISFTLFMRKAIDRLRNENRIRTAETYTSALNSFRKFLSQCQSTGNKIKEFDIMLDCINAPLIEEYEGWLKKRGIVPNSISFYTRILRAVYNKAVDSGIISNQFPFRHVYTGIDKTVKRALPLKLIKKIKDIDLTCRPKIEFSRDMFILSFMFRGMSLIDMAFLKKSDLVNGYIYYRRRKTGQLLSIKWTDEMQHILDKYPENDSDYLLPIIKRRGINERCSYRNVGYNINRGLKIIAAMLHIPMKLTLYVARHSWASAAHAKGIPLRVISEGMGHGSETTTMIYLASIDRAEVDKANSIILSSL